MNNRRMSTIDRLIIHNLHHDHAIKNRPEENGWKIIGDDPVRVISGWIIAMMILPAALVFVVFLASIVVSIFRGQL